MIYNEKSREKKIKPTFRWVFSCLVFLGFLGWVFSCQPWNKPFLLVGSWWDQPGPIVIARPSVYCIYWVMQWQLNSCGQNMVSLRWKELEYGIDMQLRAPPQSVHLYDLVKCYFLNLESSIELLKTKQYYYSMNRPILSRTVPEISSTFFFHFRSV